MLYVLSIHLAGCGVVNLWCIQYMIELYHSIYAYNQMRLYTTINDALNVCYQYDIWHMWNTRSNTVNQHTFTSSDPDYNTWLERGIYVSSADVLFHHLHPACALLRVVQWFILYILIAATVTIIIIIIVRTICIGSYCDAIVLKRYFRKSRSICGLCSGSIVISGSFDEDNAGSIIGTVEYLNYDRLRVS